MQDVFDALLLLMVLTGGVFLLVLLGVTIRWCVSDARRRGKSPVLVSAAVIFFFPWGLIAWLVFRPDPLGRVRGQQQFRLQDFRRQ